MLFFGIEELGVQIEEPFSILPLEDFVASIELAASQMLANEGNDAQHDAYVPPRSLSTPPCARPPSPLLPLSVQCMAI